MTERALDKIKAGFEVSFPRYKFAWRHEREACGDLESDALVLEAFNVPAGGKLDFAIKAGPLRRASEEKAGRHIFLVSHTTDATARYYRHLFTMPRRAVSRTGTRRRKLAAGRKAKT